ncbi:pigment-dispersing hormone peptides [Anabrus simplex]|uniref:pigment-dispersing hormone peptides n=1 Tax=Anabrus simplex TaxID=316456 RepID=UPI0034DD0360
MNLLPLVLILVTLLKTQSFSATAMQIEEDKYLDKEYSRELAAWLMDLVRRTDAPTICTHKRNSELINSLLGLPKVLNDAGRK